MSGYEIRPFEAGDEESLLATFNLVFGEGNPGYRPRTMAEWRWAFEENPAGKRIMVAVKDGQVVAQNACIPERVWLADEERIFAQSVDSFCHPEHRRGLKRPGLWVNVVLEFIDAYGGPDKDLYHYGWPIWSAWRMGKTFLGYEVLRTQTLLVKALSGEPKRNDVELDAFLASVGVECFAVGAGMRDWRFDHEARWLWDRLANQWGTSAIRDDAFLNWRLVDHPRHRYTVLTVRNDEGILWGYAVYRHGDWIERDMGILVDWMAPPPTRPDGECGGRLLRALEALAASDRGGRAASVTGIFPDWAVEFAHVQAQGWRVHPSDYFMIGHHYHRAFDPLWLRSNWWYTLIDTDLV